MRLRGLLDHTLTDLRYAVRLASKAPGFSIVAIASLALGIGANLTIFTIADGLLLRSLPVERPRDVVAVYEVSAQGGGFSPMAYPDVLDYRARTRSLAALAAYELTNLGIGVGAESELVAGMLVDGEYFRTLGVHPSLGRVLGAMDDDRSRPATVALISDALWRRRFGAAPGVIGTSIAINGTWLTIVGVAPRDFVPVLGLSIDVYAPLALRPTLVPTAGALTDRAALAFNVVGRLAPGANIARVREELSLVARAIDTQWPRRVTARRVTVTPATILAPGARAPVAVAALLLLSVTALVLLLACINLANLLMARSAARRRELAVRAALGATRGRLVRQLVLEGAVLSSIGALGALGLAHIGTKALLIFLPPTPVPLVVDFAPGVHGFAAAAVVAILSALLFSLGPALHVSRQSLVDALRDASVGSGHGVQTVRQRRRTVGVQVAVTTLLLITAGLFVRSLRHAESIDPGFAAANMLIATVDAGPRFPDAAKGEEFYRRFLAELQTTPDVTAAALVDRLPLDAGSQATTFEIERGPHGATDYNVVSPGYFATMRVALAYGRNFATASGATDGNPEAIINETMARRYFGGAAAIGRRVSVHGSTGPWMEVVGIARDGKYRSLSEQPQPFIYLPFRGHYRGEMTVLIGTPSEARRALSAVRAVLTRLDPNLPLYNVRTLKEHMHVSLLPARIASALLGALGMLTLCLAALGVYGVMAFGTQLRRTEMGVRLALGAEPQDVITLVVRQGMAPVAAGLVSGLLLALLVCRAAQRFLYGITAADPVTYVAVTAIIVVTALTACLVPAWRISRTDPASALRSE